MAQRISYRRFDGVPRPGGFNITGLDRTPSERIEWLTRHVHDDLWPKVKPRLILLVSEGAKVSKGVLSRRDECLEVIRSRD